MSKVNIKINNLPLEVEQGTLLIDAARQLGIGPMGSRGINAVLAINLDAAVTHTAALPVAVNACLKVVCTLPPASATASRPSA